MLDPQDRRLLREALRPPAGFALDRAVMTTFSLDLMALLTIPLSFTFFQMEDQDGPPAADPLALLEALRRYASRLMVFCQTGRIAVPKRTQLLFGYLENSIHEVMSPRGGVFHPKLTVLRFVEGGAGAGSQELSDVPVRYRLLISSRNLTFDRSWDTLLTLEGALTHTRKSAFKRNRPLSDFVAALPQFMIRSPSEGYRAAIASIADELLRVDFETPEEFEDFEFQPIGHDKKSCWPWDKYDRMLVVAPFIDDRFLDRLSTQSTEHHVVSRKESLDCLAGETVKSTAGSYVLAPSVDPDSDDDDASLAQREVPAGNDCSLVFDLSEQLNGLHAKLFVADSGWKAHIWTGSANATSAAFERNVEFLVKLVGSKKRHGVSAMLSHGDDDDASTDRKVSFADLLLPYHRINAAESDTETERLAKLIDEVHTGFANSRLSVHVRELTDAGSGRFEMLLVAPNELTLQWQEEVHVSCWPVTLREEAAAVLTSPVLGNAARFGPISFEAISSFWAFSLTAKSDRAECHTKFVLSLPLVDAPSDREHRILLALLRNREQLVRYLLMLLSDDEDAANRLNEIMSADLSNRHQARDRQSFGLPLLEPLLQTLDIQPAKLDQIARLVSDLRRTPDGEALLTEEFLSVWSPIWEERQRQHAEKGANP